MKNLRNLITAAATMLAVASLADPIAYLDDQGVERLCENYTVVTSDTYSFSDGVWYVVTNEVARDWTIDVSGSAHLILCDAGRLTVTAGYDRYPGIRVASGTSLTIYGQAGGTGELWARGGYFCAGIGCGYYTDGGAVTINGGKVMAFGGPQGPGIGGGYYGNGGTVTVNGGTVMAEGSFYGAGIGGGYEGNGGTVTVNGGTVTATGGEQGAGIGGGIYGNGGTVTVNGGTVTAIGGGSASGIGGGTEADGGAVTINCGTVRAVGGSEGTGIGCGKDGATNGTLKIADGLNIQARGAAFERDGDGMVVHEGCSGFLFQDVNPFTTTQVSYLDENGTEQIRDCTVLDQKVCVLEDGQWYAVTNGVNFTNDAIQVNGSAYLVLCDGGKMTAQACGFGEPGVRVEDGSSLTIYGQAENSGELVAVGNGHCAGIGGGFERDGGVVTINGGTVTAIGDYYSAGIGGGFGGAGGNVTINGGMVMATSDSYGAGIGGGYQGDGGVVTINGGTVMAACRDSRAFGFGAGPGGEAGTVQIAENLFVQRKGSVYSYSENDPPVLTGYAYYLVRDDNPFTYVEVPYLDENGVEQIRMCQVVDEDVWNFEDGGWYAVTNGVDVTNDTISVIGSANLVLCAGGKLTLGTVSGPDQGLRVEEGSALTIYGQTGGNGSLVCFGSSNGAGLGGLVHCGVVTINGGTVTAKGGYYAAGIGGGYHGNGGTVTVNGGTVTTTGGGYGAGIGCGYYGNGGTVTVNGGTVTAKGGNYGAGIGSGYYGNSGTVTVNGGTVTAKGGNYGAGIGSGRNGGVSGVVAITNGTVTATGGDYAAGIGGSESGVGGTVTVDGGTVMATGGTYGAGIGGGRYGAGGTVTITDGTVTATGGDYGAGIGGGYDARGGTVSVNGGMVSAFGGRYSCAGIGGGGYSSNHGALTTAADVDVFYGDTEEMPDTKARGADGSIALAGERYYSIEQKLQETVVSLALNKTIKTVRKDLIGFTAGKLPTGLKFNSNTGTFTGTVKTAVSVPVVFTDGEETKTVIIRIGNVRRVRAVVDGAGKVTPSVKDAAPGKAISFKATASKNNVFSGWHAVRRASDGSYRFGKLISRNPTLSFKVGSDDEQFIGARFIPARQDVAPRLVVGKVQPNGNVDEKNLSRMVSIYVGVATKFKVDVEAVSLVKLSASSLPKGLSFNKSTGVISGVPSKVQYIYTTIKGVNASRKATSIGIAFEIMPLPDPCVGSFDGYFYRPATESEPVSLLGAAKMTVGATGKVSGSISTTGGVYTFSAKNLTNTTSDSDIFSVTVTPKCKTKSLGKVIFTLSRYSSLGSPSGTLTDGRRIVLRQNLWKRTDEFKYYAPVFPKAGVAVKLESGLSLKIGPKGVVTVAGTVVGDKNKKVKISATAQYILEDVDAGYAVIYVAPKTGLKKGYLDLVSLRLDIDESSGSYKVKGVREAPLGA